MKLLRDLWQICKKDLLEFRRDRLRLVTFIIMPMFMMILTGYIFPSQSTLQNIPLGLVQLDSAAASQKIVEIVTQMKTGDTDPAFKIKTYTSLEAIKEGIKKQEISGGVVIPENFSTALVTGQVPQVTIVEDQSNPQISSLITQVLTKLFTQSGPLQKTVDVKVEGMVPNNPNYFEFVAPGIIAMIVMTAVLTGLAASISREKEQGTLDGILISPISRLAIILGKALSQALRGLIQGGIVLLLAWLLFGVTIQGNLLLVLLILILGIFSFVGLGILVSAMAAEQETATQLLFMFQFPMLFLSGTFFPILMMPNFMQQISKVIPLTYAITALRKVMVLGAGFNAIQTEFWVLLIFGLVTLSISVPVFKRVITK